MLRSQTTTIIDVNSSERISEDDAEKNHRRLDVATNRTQRLEQRQRRQRKGPKMRSLSSTGTTGLHRRESQTENISASIGDNGRRFRDAGHG